MFVSFRRCCFFVCLFVFFPWLVSWVVQLKRKSHLSSNWLDTGDADYRLYLCQGDKNVFPQKSMLASENIFTESKEGTQAHSHCEDSKHTTNKTEITQTQPKSEFYLVRLFSTQRRLGSKAQISVWTIVRLFHNSSIVALYCVENYREIMMWENKHCKQDLESCLGRLLSQLIVEIREGTDWSQDGSVLKHWTNRDICTHFAREAPKWFCWNKTCKSTWSPSWPEEYKTPQFFESTAHCKSSRLILTAGFYCALVRLTPTV